MIRVLFLDDDATRYKFLEGNRLLLKNIPEFEFVWVSNMKDFEEKLMSEDFDVVSLDHDLEIFEENEYGRRHEITGMDASKKLIGILGVATKQKIIIHSWNSVGARNMQKYFKDKNLFAPWIPYATGALYEAYGEQV